MSSAALLGTKPGERILDLCAAPGGKSTQIADDLQGEGFLLSNDLSASRARALLKNIELMGIGNCCISCEDSGRLKNEYPLFFDRILVDAPCSGNIRLLSRPGWSTARTFTVPCSPNCSTMRRICSVRAELCSIRLAPITATRMKIR